MATVLIPSYLRCDTKMVQGGSDCAIKFHLIAYNSHLAFDNLQLAADPVFSRSQEPGRHLPFSL